MRKNWMHAQICFRSGRCSTKWPRADGVSGEQCSGHFRCDSEPGSSCRRAAESGRSAEAGRNHRQGAGERHKAALPERRRNSHGFATAEAGHRIRTRSRGNEKPRPRACHYINWAAMDGDCRRCAGGRRVGCGRVALFCPQGAALTEKDTIVLSDFTNTTGDAIFDDTLKTALTRFPAAIAFLECALRQRSGEDLATDDPSG